MLFADIIRRARWREHVSCTGRRLVSKVARWSQPTVDVLSDSARQQDNGGILPSCISIHIVTILAMYSSTLFVCSVRKFGGM